MSMLAQGGWFFDEWYWEPIFRRLKVLPFLGIVALVTAIVARGAGSRRSGTACGWRWASS